MGAVKNVADAFGEMRRKAEPASYEAAGKTIKCSHCASDLFRKRRVVIHGPLAHCLVCSRCGLAAWFEKAPSLKGSA